MGPKLRPLGSPSCHVVLAAALLKVGPEAGMVSPWLTHRTNLLGSLRALLPESCRLNAHPLCNPIRPEVIPPRTGPGQGKFQFSVLGLPVPGHPTPVTNECGHRREDGQMLCPDRKPCNEIPFPMSPHWTCDSSYGRNGIFFLPGTGFAFSVDDESRPLDPSKYKHWA